VRESGPQRVNRKEKRRYNYLEETAEKNGLSLSYIKRYNNDTGPGARTFIKFCLKKTRNGAGGGGVHCTSWK